MTLQVQELAYHRNGVSGEGFYVIRFLFNPDDEGIENFLAVVFDTPGQCAVIGLDRISTQGVKFAGGNSWRGDWFESELREAIKTMSTSGGTRIGSFCVPTD